MPLNNNLFANQAKIYNEVDKTSANWLRRQSKFTYGFTLLVFVLITVSVLVGGSNGKISVTVDRELFAVGVYGDAQFVRYDSGADLTIGGRWPDSLDGQVAGKEGVCRFTDAETGREVYVYCYTDVNRYIVAADKERVIIFNCSSVAETEEIYRQLIDKMP